MKSLKDLFDNSNLQEPEEWGNITLDGIDDKTLLSKNWDRNLAAAEGWSQNQGTLSPKQKQTLVRDWWNSRRDHLAKQTLAEKYGVSEHYVQEVGGNAKYFSRQELQDLKTAWYKKYGFCFRVISPGCDQLDYYDQANQEREEQFRLLLPPSIIYHYRFVEPNWRPRDVKTLYPHIKGNTLLPLLRNRVKWLTDKPSETQTFYKQTELVEWVETVTGARSVEYHIHKNETMTWGGKLAGWQFHRLTEKRYWYENCGPQ